MTNTNLYVDVNVLQTVPSSNINRDDTGAPKTAIYGGVTRARVSSQSWKHAMRVSFNKDGVTAGVRTKEVASMLADALKELNDSMSEDDAMKKAVETLTAAGIKVNKDGQTGALLLVSHGQIKKLAEYTINNDEIDKKDVKAVLKGTQSLDLALFGRMVADNPELNVDASAQVAHAISTHEIVPEFDYFTALDDLQPEDNSGAAMLGTIEYNSATLYRYANVNVKELAENIGNDGALKGVAEFIKQFVLSMPSGKQNTFANKTLPSYVMVAIRTDTPVNLVSAFETPVTSNHGYVSKSITNLEKANSDAQKIVDKPLLTVALDQKSVSAITDQAENLTNLLNQVTDSLKEVMPDEDTNN
ncbi:CRISPR-associated protein [Secundilactobacillus silagincola]|uniref:CRISPR-associated protein n=1 Tax=Secundilactobacillus silagincola TaxID=1714681 RepID=A0A1Z5H4Z7_9LACO|nr:type I-E CRISPR-associated protein Cas7/Cse4/CasC [Secundilactobacillus silagincola]GAT18383.1 CRISPR-associated protein [Secundilactobacillus silagincola]